MKIVMRMMAMLIFSALLGCSSSLSKSEAGELIKTAWDVHYAAWSPDCTVEILGISVDDKTAIVKAVVTSKGKTNGVAFRPDAHSFFMRKYDTGWVVESFR